MALAALLMSPALCAQSSRPRGQSVLGDCLGVVARRAAEHGRASGSLACAGLPTCRARGHACATVVKPGFQGYYGYPASRGPEYASRGGIRAGWFEGPTAPKEATT